MKRLLMIAAFAALGTAAEAAPRLLDCNKADNPAYCRMAQEQYREERARPNDYQTMRNVAYCLWTNCDMAFAYDRKESCRIRREIMKRHASKVDRGDEQHFANCVQAGY